MKKNISFRIGFEIGILFCLLIFSICYFSGKINFREKNSRECYVFDIYKNKEVFVQNEDNSKTKYTYIIKYNLLIPTNYLKYVYNIRFEEIVSIYRDDNLIDPQELEYLKLLLSVWSMYDASELNNLIRKLKRDSK